MASESFAGPVDYVVFSFDAGADIGPGLAALLERVDQGVIEILDLGVVSRTADGAPTRRPLSELGATSSIDLAVFDGIESGILDDDDLASIAAELTGDQFALAVVYEDRSLAAAAEVWALAGGTEVFSGGVAIEDLEQALQEGSAS